MNVLYAFFVVGIGMLQRRGGAAGQVPRGGRQACAAAQARVRGGPEAAGQCECECECECKCECKCEFECILVSEEMRLCDVSAGEVFISRLVFVPTAAAAGRGGADAEHGQLRDEPEFLWQPGHRWVSSWLALLGCIVSVMVTATTL